MMAAVDLIRTASQPDRSRGGAAAAAKGELGQQKDDNFSWWTCNSPEQEEQIPGRGLECSEETQCRVPQTETKPWWRSGNASEWRSHAAIVHAGWSQ